MSDLILLVGSWLLTFLLHSTVWLGVAWLLLRRFPAITPSVRDWIWKGVFVGSLLSPTLQVGASSFLGWEGLNSRLLLTEAARSQDVELAFTDLHENRLAPASYALRIQAEPMAGTLEGPTLTEDGSMLATVLLPEVRVDPGVWPEPDLLAGTSVTSLDSTSAPVPNWLTWLVGIWAFGALVSITFWLTALWRLRQNLKGRMPLTSGSLVRNIQKDLARLGAARSRRIRFSLSDRIQVPVAFGLWGGEVCLPMRALQELDPAQQQTMLGHELAHLMRRDPLWLNLFQAAQRVLFLQPLLILVRREAMHAAEELCDAWAIGRSGNRVALAECLTTVAQWLRPGSQALPVACMAQPGSPLGRRVDRLLDKGSRVGPRNAAVTGSIGFGLVLLLTAMAVFAPGVASHLRPTAADTAEFDLAALKADWNLAEERIRFLELEIAVLQQELAYGRSELESPAELMHTLNQLRSQLQKLEQLSDTIRWNIESQNPS
ncbi:MAG: M56 family metallopeptidase [Planctomycetota bacterium]|jgi:beta-lactamase regulating signal transducer with metallopeptidase domain